MVRMGWYSVSAVGSLALSQDVPYRGRLLSSDGLNVGKRYDSRTATLPAYCIIFPIIIISSR